MKACSILGMKREKHDANKAYWYCYHENFVAHGEVSYILVREFTIEALLANSHQVVGILLLQKGAHLLNPVLHTMYVSYTVGTVPKIHLCWSHWK